MNTAKLIAFVTSFAFLWSLLIVLLFWLFVWHWSKKDDREQSKKRIEPPYIPMKDPEELDKILSFYKK